MSPDVLAWQLETLEEDGFVFRERLPIEPKQFASSGVVEVEDRYRITGSGVIAFDEMLHKRSSNRLSLISLCVSILALVVSIVPYLRGKDSNLPSKPNQNNPTSEMLHQRIDSIIVVLDSLDAVKKNQIEGE